ncbi:MAG: DUF924 domain-containing protein [Betaproteobacteria bacterium]|nr:DUF924 domain-containing protein [Betaproteobacteria bacterium]
MPGEIEQVLEFWFGKCGADGAIDPSRRKMWFREGRKHDAEIRRRFGALHERACRGELDDWAATARGRLALILVLDQFSRHLYRGNARACAQDAPAQRLALGGLEQGADRELAPAERAFFYLPLEHAEDRELQERSVRCFASLADGVPAASRKDYKSFLDYARRHREIIERFGRFPHRNVALGRASTPEEREFLERRGSSF